jgi:hypothetical protein
MSDTLSMEDVALLDNPRGGHYLPKYATIDNFVAYQQFVKGILDDGDYIKIGGKKCVKRSGWRKLACALRVSFQLMSNDFSYSDTQQIQGARFVYRAILPCGRFSDGWGSCNVGERHFTRPNHDIPATAETRAKNRACQDLFGLDGADE